MSEQSGSWQPDPFGRHQHRWWDGTSWTDQVSDDGVTSVDPPGDAAPGAGTPPAEAPPTGTPGPGAAATPASGGSSNVVGFAIGAVVLLVLLAGAAYLLLGGDDDGPSAAELADVFEEDGMDRESAECMGRELEGVFSADRIRELERDSDATPTMEESTAILSATGECMDGFDFDSDDIASEEGDTYGDNPVLDALWDACEGGDGEACDDLYFQSPGGSAYEEFGDTCGGRFEGGEVLCSMEDLD